MARSKARKIADLLAGGSALEDGVITAEEVTGLGTAATTAATDYATAGQGALAASALQPTGDGSGLTGLATTAMGVLASTALQPNGDGSQLTGIPAPVIASQAEAEAGTDTTKFMSPARVSQTIAALRPPTSPSLAGTITSSSAFVASGFDDTAIYALLVSASGTYTMQKSTDGVNWAVLSNFSYSRGSAAHQDAWGPHLYVDENYIAITHSANNYETLVTYVSGDGGTNWTTGSTSRTQTRWAGSTGASSFGYDGTKYYAHLPVHPLNPTTYGFAHSTNLTSWSLSTYSTNAYSATYGAYDSNIYTADGLAGTRASSLVQHNGGVSNYSSNGWASTTNDNHTVTLTENSVTSTSNPSNMQSFYNGWTLSTMGFSTNYLKVNIGDFGSLTGVESNRIYITAAGFIANRGGSVPGYRWSSIGQYPLNASSSFNPDFIIGHNDLYHSNLNQIYVAPNIAGSWTKLLYNPDEQGGAFSKSQYVRLGANKFYLSPASQNPNVGGVNVWSV